MLPTYDHARRRRSYDADRVEVLAVERSRHRHRQPGDDVADERQELFDQGVALLPTAHDPCCRPAHMRLSLAAWRAILSLAIASNSVVKTGRSNSGGMGGGPQSARGYIPNRRHGRLPLRDSSL